MRTTFRLVCVSLLMLYVSGCDNSAQKQGFQEAYQKEQQFYGDHNPFLVEDYRKVIQMEPGSVWADKAQKRIDAIQQNVNADRAMGEQRTNEMLHSH